MLSRELHPAAKHAPGSASEVRHAASRAHFFAGFGGVTRDGSPFFLEKMGNFDVYAANRSADVFDLMMDSYITYLETAFASVRPRQRSPAACSARTRLWTRPA